MVLIGLDLPEINFEFKQSCVESLNYVHALHCNGKERAHYVTVYQSFNDVWLS